jgi:hypothetical protein
MLLYSSLSMKREREAEIYELPLLCGIHIQKNEQRKQKLAMQPSFAQHADGPLTNEPIPLLTPLKHLPTSFSWWFCGDYALSEACGSRDVLGARLCVYP